MTVQSLENLTSLHLLLAVLLPTGRTAATCTVIRQQLQALQVLNTFQTGQFHLQCIWYRTGAYWR